MKTAETLQRGKEILLRDGWTQGKYHKDGKYCASGALIVAANEFNDENAWDEACETLKEATGASYVCYWNDDSRRTFAEVMEAFDAAIILAKESEA